MNEYEKKLKVDNSQATEQTAKSILHARAQEKHPPSNTTLQTFGLAWANPPQGMEMQGAVIPPNPNPAGLPLTRVHTAPHKYTHTLKLGGL